MLALAELGVLGARQDQRVALRQIRPGARADQRLLVLGQRRVAVLEQRLRRRLNREITPVRGARIVTRRSEEGTRDHARHVVRRDEHPARLLARAIQFVERDRLLVGRDLKNRVR